MVALEIGLPSANPATLATVVGRLRGLPGGSGRALTPLSILAWSADQFAYGEWIERSGFADFPWTLASEGRREAQRRRQFALARGEPAGLLTERSGEVIREAVGWCFSDAAWCLLLGWIQISGLRVSGVQAGSRTVVDPLVLVHLVVDLEHDTATTRDGELTWHALTVEWPRTLQAEFGKWYAGAYPSGHPVGKKHDELAHEAAHSLGSKVSGRTVRRALRDFRRL
ncbi:MAG TPA: hypothetical protein VLA02_11535 [Reyranella sp.]|nr:hypothetical protein [Reyranella sp.]